MGRISRNAWLSTPSAMRAMLAAALSLASLPSFATGVTTTGDPIEYFEFTLSEQSTGGGIWEDVRATSDTSGPQYPGTFNDGYDEYTAIHETFRFGEFNRGLMSAYASHSGTFWAEMRGARGFQGSAEGGIEHWLLKTAPDAKLSMVVTGGELLIGGNFDPDVPLFAEVYLEGVLTRYIPGGGLATEVRTYGHKVRLCGSGGTFASETYGMCVNGGDLPEANVVYTESNLLAFELDTVYQAKVEILPSVIDIDLSGVAINEQFFFDVSAFVSTVIPFDAPESYAYAYLRDPVEVGDEGAIGSGIQFSGLTSLSPPIPEPGTATLFVLGAALMGGLAFRRSAKGRLQQ
jgi:hypothetical protein